VASNTDQRGASPAAGDGVLSPVLRSLAFVLVWPAFAFACRSGVVALFCPNASGSTCSGAALDYSAVVGECLAAVLLAFGFRSFLDRKPPDSLGLSLRPNALRFFAIGAAFGAGMQTLVFVLEYASGSLHVSALAPIRADVISWATIIPLLAIAALAEELPLRGYLFQNLRVAWGDPLALAATSLLFALLHLANPGAHRDVLLTLTGIVAAGAWFCVSVIWTRSLWLALGAHIAWNLFEGPVYGFPVSGLVIGGNSAVKSVVDGPTWLTGGSFGPEAGVSSLVALAAGAVVLYILHRRGILVH
jgi:membrane protease YdiL (CAAX protease family)